MLRLRICPNCQEEIRSPKVYFCHCCGTELPSPKIEETPQSVETGHPTSLKLRGTGAPSLPKEVKNRKLIGIVIATLVVAFITAVGVGVYWFQINPSLPSLPSAPKNEAFVSAISFEVPNHPFSAKGLSEIVPADVDLYLESVDPEILLPSLVSAEDWSEVEKFFDEQVGLSPTEVASFLEDEFAVVQESTASAFLARVKDVDFLEQKIEEVGSHEGWQAKMVNGFLVVSNSPELIHAVEEAQKKLTLNLSLTSGFAEARKKLPKTGQIFVYGKKRLEFIPDSVTGEAFVVSKKDGGILITGL